MNINAQTIAQWKALGIKIFVFGVAILLKKQSFFFKREQGSAINSHWLWWSAGQIELLWNNVGMKLMSVICKFIYSNILTFCQISLGLTMCKC